MARRAFGDCIGCAKPIVPPYLTFKVMWAHGDGNSITEWEEVDVCESCAGKLTANELHRLVSADEEVAA